jgi:hypothetical protein
MLILATFGVAFGLIALALFEVLGVLPATMMAWLVGMVSAGWILAALWCAWLDWSFRKKTSG